MSSLLSEMAQASLQRVQTARAQLPESALWSRATDTPPAPILRLSPEGFDLIAECKLQSPSAGDLSANTTDVAARVISYAQAGAALISVLTEPTRFGGTLEHLTLAASALAPLNVPVMRKDFLVDPYQVMEARIAGAAGVLVIARMLDKTRLCSLFDCAAMLKMFVLVEAFDDADLEVINDVVTARKGREEQVLVGINCRDLATLQVDFHRLAELADRLPEHLPHVAESGVSTAADVERVVELGYRLALVGTSLMSSGDPRRLADEMIVAGRRKALARQAEG
jgi:indole-3-glycerol phosphate synthase